MQQLIVPEANFFSEMFLRILVSEGIIQKVRLSGDNGKYFGQKSLFLPPSKFGYFFFLPCFFDRIFRKFMGSDQNWAKRRNFSIFVLTYKDLNRKKWQENREIYVRQWKNREGMGFSFIAISFISSLFF